MRDEGRGWGLAVSEINGYSDLVQIGAGGFSTVYRGKQSRFDRECRAAGAVSEHPNALTVVDAGETVDGRPYIAMEYMVRGPLPKRVAAEGPRPVSDLLDIVVKIVGVLGAVHGAGLLHRDIKRQNILMSAFG